MASEYLLKKAREEYVPEEVRELTPAEKRRNWWHYYKWYVVAGIVLVLCIANIVGSALGIGKIRPDVSIAYVGTHTLSEETVQTLTDGIAALCTDFNGDGRILVDFHQYVNPDVGDADNLLYAEAAQLKLIGDITECRSYFFLMEDPDAFQRLTTCLRNLDGSLHDEDTTAEGKVLPLGACPVFAGMNLGEQIESLSFGRRGFWTEKTSPNAEDCDALWAALTGHVS